MVCWNRTIFYFVFVVFFAFRYSAFAKDVNHGTPDGSEEWGYIEVRPNAHMFWWLYRSPGNKTDLWPLILWLQGGPGGSGVGIGNFEEIGPLDTNLRPRNSTWLQKAHLLFVDSPVGTGFSYIKNDSLAVKSDEEAAKDLLTFLKRFLETNRAVQNNPVFIVGESYGGKHASILGLVLSEAITSGDIKLNLGGVVLADSWISPVDYVLSWGPLLKDVSRMDATDENNATRVALKIQEQLARADYEQATSTWFDLEDLISSATNNVVDALLSRSVSVTIYNGQVDLICATKGTEAWVQKLKWSGLREFNAINRTPLYCDGDLTKGFVKSYKNLKFFWILLAGHFVPVDQPCLALKMVDIITNKTDSPK